MKRAPLCRRAVAIVPAMLFSVGATGAGAQSPASWRLVEEWRISGEAQHAARRPIAAVVRGDETIVADAGRLQVVVLGRTGQVRLRLGRVGRGPGEYQSIDRVGTLGDSIWVMDNALRRLTVLGLDGGVRSTTQLTFPRLTDAPSASLPVALLADGTVLASNIPRPSERTAPAGLAAPLFRVTRTGAFVDTVAVLSLRHTWFYFRDSRTSTQFRQRYSDDPVLCVAGDGSAVAIVFREVPERAEGASYRVRTVTATGEVIFDRRVAYTPQRLASAERDTVRALVGRTTGLSGRMSIVDALLYLPRFRPPVGKCIVGADGSVWVAEVPDEETRQRAYHVITRNGTPLGRVRLSSDLNLLDVSASHLVASILIRGASPSLVRYRIERESHRP